MGGAPASKGAYWDAVCLPAHITTAALDGGTIGFSSKRTRIGSIILIGARLDAEPELLFGLRKVDAKIDRTRRAARHPGSQLGRRQSDSGLVETGRRVWHRLRRRRPEAMAGETGTVFKNHEICAIIYEAGMGDFDTLSKTLKSE